MARPIKLLSVIAVCFVVLGLVLSPRIGAARPIQMNKAFVVRDGVQHGCRAEDLDAAPFAAPSSAHRWGTVVIGCYDKNYRAHLEEWDLYAGRVLRAVKLPTPSGDNQIRVAHGAGHVAVVLADAMQGGGTARVLLLDDSFNLDKSWAVGGYADFADIASDGALAVVTARGEKGTRVMALDLSRERVIARRVLSTHGQPVMASPNQPEQVVRVHGKDVFLALHTWPTLRVLRLDQHLRTKALYRWHSNNPYPDYDASDYWLALDRGQPVFQFRGKVYTFSRGLGHATLLRAIKRLNGPARWAISPKGLVATEDGRIAASKGAPFVRALRFTNEVVVRGMKREIRANATRYVFWAFGRAVIVRSAWNVGITAIQLH